MKAILKTKNLFICILAIIATSGCAFIYEPDIQQGNIVSDEMLDNLELGMSKAEAQYYLGTPLVEDPFHINRWDYFYNFKKGREDEREQTVITLLFDDYDSLVDITGSTQSSLIEVSEVNLPNEGELNQVISDPEEEVENRPGFWQRIKSKVLGQ